MRIKRRYKKFLKLWTERMELERHVVKMEWYENYQNPEFIEYRIDILGGRRTISIGGYDKELARFYWNTKLGRSRACKYIKILMENGLKERVKVLVDEFQKAV